MSTKTVRPDGLGVEIAALLTEYSDEIADAIKEDCKQVAKETADELRQTSPKRTGIYASGWKAKIAFENRETIRIAVHNSKKPQITQLLEFGHITKNGTGRKYENTPEHPHILAAEQHAREKLEQKAKVTMK